MKWCRSVFDRNEFSSAFGDIGTSIPLVIGVISASGIDVASALIMFVAIQIFTGINLNSWDTGSQPAIWVCYRDGCRFVNLLFTVKNQD